MIGAIVGTIICFAAPGYAVLLRCQKLDALVSQRRENGPAFMEKRHQYFRICRQHCFFGGNYCSSSSCTHHRRPSLLSPRTDVCLPFRILDSVAGNDYCLNWNRPTRSTNNRLLSFVPADLACGSVGPVIRLKQLYTLTPSPPDP